jgi:uncharacterized protein YecE (DUF72 family)
MLGLYGRSFSVVEFNYTWYQMARSDVLTRMLGAAPAHIVFAAKLTRTVTHEREDDWREQVQRYRRGIGALGKGWLPSWCSCRPLSTAQSANRCFLAELLDCLQGCRWPLNFATSPGRSIQFLPSWSDGG